MAGKEKQRNTKQRQEVYEAVMQRSDHPGADEIYLDVRRKDEHISKGTVYRNLNLLAENGDILHSRLAGGGDRFDRTAFEHYHLICTQCGKVIDVPVDYRAEDDKTVAQATGFRIAGHRTIFEGICPDCQDRLKNV